MSDFTKSDTCEYCGETVDPLVEYSIALTCSRCEGNYEGKTLYHQECIDNYQKSNKIHKSSATGYVCPRGRGKGSLSQGVIPCLGKIVSSHQRCPNRKKKMPAQPPPLVIKPVPVSKQLRPSNASAPVAKIKPLVDRDEIQKKVQVRRNVASTNQGDVVHARLCGNTSQGSARLVPGMESQIKVIKQAKKKDTPAVNSGKQSDSTMSKAKQVQELPHIEKKSLQQAFGSQKLVTDINRYKMLVGDTGSDSDRHSNHDSEREDTSQADVDTTDTLSSQSYLSLGDPSQAASLSQTAKPESSAAAYPTPREDGGATDHMALNDPPQAFGVVDWGGATGRPIFNFDGLDVTSSIPDELIGYLSTLPQDKSELYVNELCAYVSAKAHAAEEAARRRIEEELAVEEQQQLQHALLASQLESVSHAHNKVNGGLPDQHPYSETQVHEVARLCYEKPQPTAHQSLASYPTQQSSHGFPTYSYGDVRTTPAPLQEPWHHESSLLQEYLQPFHQALGVADSSHGQATAGASALAAQARNWPPQSVTVEGVFKKAPIQDDGEESDDVDDLLALCLGDA